MGFLNSVWIWAVGWWIRRGFLKIRAPAQNKSVPSDMMKILNGPLWEMSPPQPRESGNALRRDDRDGEKFFGPGQEVLAPVPPHFEPITCSADGNPAICSDPNRNIHGTPDGWEGSASGGAVGPGGSRGRMSEVDQENSVLMPENSFLASRNRENGSLLTRESGPKISECDQAQNLRDLTVETSRAPVAVHTFAIRMVHCDPSEHASSARASSSGNASANAGVTSQPNRCHTRRVRASTTSTEPVKTDDAEWNEIFDYSDTSSDHSVLEGVVPCHPISENIQSGRVAIGPGVYWNEGPPTRAAKPPTVYDRSNDPVNRDLELEGPFSAPNQHWCCLACGGYWWREGGGYDVSKREQEDNAPTEGSFFPVMTTRVCSECRGEIHFHADRFGHPTAISHQGQEVCEGNVWRYHGADLWCLGNGVFLSRPKPTWPGGRRPAGNQILWNPRHLFTMGQAYKGAPQSNWSPQPHHPDSKGSVS